MTDVNSIFGIKEKPKGELKTPERQSIEQTEDYAVKQVIHTKEGTIEKVPVDDSDIVNKKFVDDSISAIPAPDLTGLVPYTGATTNVELGDHYLTATTVSAGDVVASTKFTIHRDHPFRVTYTGGEVPVNVDYFYPFDTGGMTYDATSWWAIPDTTYDPANYVGGMQFYNKTYYTLFGGICGTTGDLHWEKNFVLIGAHYFGDTNTYISQDTNFLHIVTDKVIDIGNQMQFNTGGALSFMGSNVIQWWDVDNNTGYDVNLYRATTGVLKTDFNFQATNIDFQTISVNTVPGISATITTAKLTSGGANGSMTFVNGILTAQTPAT